MIGLAVGVSSGQVGSGKALLPRATAQLGGVQPYHYWDFLANRATFAGTEVGPIENTPNWSFSRASAAEARDSTGAFASFASGVLRRNDRGILIEGSRTNLFLNSMVGATQSITVTATAYTLSFYGTGTITLSGVSTAGPLVGTGANNLVTLTFTPTAGTLTCTVSGACTRVQLEAGAFGSSHIVTTGASATRAADLLTVSSPGVSYPLGIFVEFERAVDSGGVEVVFEIDNGTTSDRSAVYIGADDVPNFLVVGGSATQAAVTVGAAVAVGAATKVAGRIATNDARAARGGSLSAQDTSVTTPATPSRIIFGVDATSYSFGYIRRAAVFNSGPSDAELQAMTT